MIIIYKYCFCREGTIRKLEDLYSDLNTGWLSWTIGLLVRKPIQWTVGTFVKKPLYWTFSKMFGNEDGREPSVQYVVMEQLKVVFCTYKLIQYSPL